MATSLMQRLVTYRRQDSSQLIRKSEYTVVSEASRNKFVRAKRVVSVQNQRSTYHWPEILRSPAWECDLYVRIQVDQVEALID